MNRASREFHLPAFSAGNGANTGASLHGLRKVYAGKKRLLVGAGASSHREAQGQALLAAVNPGLAEKDWRVTLRRCAPNAPEQNPVEDLWRAGKHDLRKRFSENKTVAAGKEALVGFWKSFLLDSVKFAWSAPSPQII